MQKNNDWTNAAIGWMVILTVIFLALLLSSCMTDRKALGRVLTNPALIAQVAKTLPPCANDTTFVHDTTILHEINTMYDTSYIQRNDTLIEFITKTEYKDRIRTITNTVIDTRAAEAWRDSAARYMNYTLAKDEQLRHAQGQLQSSRQKGRTKNWIIISFVLALILTNGFWIYLKIKS